MRRSLTVAVLAGSTAITAPQRAEAGPALAFLGGAFNALTGLGGGILAATGAVGAWSAGFHVGSWLGTSFLGRMLVSVGLNYIDGLLMQSRQPEASARMVNFSQPITYAEWVLGRTRKGGPIAFTGGLETDDPVAGIKAWMKHYTVIVAAHPIKGVVSHYLDERVAEVDAGGLVITAPMTGHYRIRVFTGHAGQVADPVLVATFPEITAAHDFAGLAGAHIWAKRPKQEDAMDVYPRARRGDWTPVIDGSDQIYDPRSGTTGFSRNAALLMAWWITRIRGLEVDWDEVASEADICDQVVANGDGGVQPRWRIDGVLTDEQTFEDQLAQMAAACDAMVYERPDGKVGFRVGRWIEPEVTIVASDCTAMTFSTGEWGANAPTEVSATYIEPANRWREAPSAPYVLEAGPRQVRDTPSLKMVASHNQACRINKRLGRTKRAETKLEMSVGMIGYRLIGHRFFRLERPDLGLSGYFEIGELYRRADGMGFDVVANSVKPEDFDFDPATEEGPRPEFKAVASDNTVPPPGGLTGTALDGGSIRWSWPAQDESLSQQLRIREAGGDWEVYTIDSATQITTTGLTDGTTYEAQLRNRTGAYRVSEWAPVAPVSVKVVANSTPPAGVIGFSAGGAGADVVLSWTAPNDPNYHATRVYRGTTSTFSAATVIAAEYGAPGAADGFTDAAPGSGVWFYWAEPINASGVAGPVSGPQSATVP